ncbi:hypothetical protein AYO38_03275 [bacterium SCGC AG-212-C10]|nr:hypothetical protein AYO38_03275 [bacterium SCGC AG-212-C10]
MRFSVWPSPSAPWSEIQATALHAEKMGWDGVWFADHFMPNAADNSGPNQEAWTTMAGLAASVPRVRIGTLVTGNTYRHPAVLAKMAAGVDIISGGRLVFGIGSGWQENEHEAYGIPFYTVGSRLRRLDEACQVIKSLFANEKTNFDGKYYQLKDAPLAPKPVQSPVPFLIGGGGENVTLKIAAKYADEWNVWGTPEVLAKKGAILDAHCNDIGRDPSAIKHSTQGVILANEKSPLAGRMGDRGRQFMGDNAEQMKEVVQAYKEANVHEIIFPMFFLPPGGEGQEALDRFITDVAPAFR